MEEQLVDNVVVLEGAEEVVEAAVKNDKLAKYGLAGAGVVIVGTGLYFGYKKVLKPGVAKIKTKLAERKAEKEAKSRRAMSNIGNENYDG